MKDSRDFRGRARHECSHAIIGWLRGLKIQRLSLVGPIRDVPGERNSPFLCDLKGPAMVALNQLSPGDIFTRTYVHLSPFISEGKKKSGVSFGALKDVQEAMNVLLWLDQEPLMALVYEAREAREKHGGDWKAAAQAFAEKCSGPVKELLESPNAKRCSKALEQELLKRGSLTGYEAASILEDNWQGPLPPEVKPRSEHSTGLAGRGAEDCLQAALRLTRMIFEILKEHDHEDLRCERAAEEFLKMLFWLSNLVSHPGCGDTETSSQQKSDGA